MRSMANTSITFGPFINVPVKMYSAVEDSGVRFNLFHVHDDGSASRIEMPCVCKDCGEAVPRNQLVKGVERDDTPILVTDDELAGVESDSGREFDILAFLHQDEIDPLLFEQPITLSLTSSAARKRSRRI